MRSGMEFGRGRGGHGHGHRRHPGMDMAMVMGRGRGGPRGRRMFDGGELKLLLLRLVADEPRHGYDVIREIEGRTGGAYAPSPGVVYPTLTLLADMGLIEEQPGEGARKLFAATAAGTAHLAENADAAAGLIERIAALGAMREQTDGGPVRRAMGNLRMALQTRLDQDGVTKDSLHDVAAILDEAAQRIERLA